MFVFHKNLRPESARVIAPIFRKLFAASLISLAVVVGYALAADPLVTLSTAALKFADQSQGTSSAPQRVTLANSGGAELTISGITITGENTSDFAQTNDCPVSPATLAAGATCVIEVTFRPTMTGALTAALTIADNASGSPHTVGLTGTGTQAVPIATFSPTSVNFGAQAVGTTSAPRAVVVTNAGGARLNIVSPITITGANNSEFNILTARTTCPVGGGELLARAHCEIAVGFAPTSLGAKSAQITVVDDAAGSPHIVPLVGTGTSPAASRPQP